MRGGGAQGGGDARVRCRGRSVWGSKTEQGKQRRKGGGAKRVRVDEQVRVWSFKSVSIALASIVVAEQQER